MNEETVVPGGEKPVGSSIEGHYPKKISVPSRGAATEAITAVKVI